LGLSGSISDRRCAVKEAIREAKLLITADVAHQDAHGVPARGCRNGFELDENQLIALVH
jgi:hypothetical protein